VRNKLIAFILVVFVLENCGCEKDNVTAPPNWDLSGRIVFNPISGSGENRGILVLDLNSPALSLTTLVHDGIEPRVNREGSEVVFTGWQPGSIDIFTTKISGGNTIDLTPDPFLTDSWPDWSPDGQSIVFNRVHYPVTKEALYVMSKDGSNLRALTDTSLLAAALMPRWSPDGSAIAFVGQVSFKPPSTFSLYTIAPDGSHQVLLDQVGSIAPSSLPSWSPDSRKIAYGKANVSLTDTTGGLYIIDVASKATHKIDFDSAKITELGSSWLPDGSLICVGLNLADSAYGVFIASTPPSPNKKLIAKGFRPAPVTSPSPDGKRVAIFGTRTEYPVFALYLVGSDGTGFQKLKDIESDSNTFINDWCYSQWVK